jgi:hypothetical protein
MKTSTEVGRLQSTKFILKTSQLTSVVASSHSVAKNHYLQLIWYKILLIPKTHESNCYHHFHCPNLPTTPITAMGCRQYLPLKGQIILEGFLVSSISSKNQTKEFDFTSMITQVDLFSFVFWRK